MAPVTPRRTQSERRTATRSLLLASAAEAVLDDGPSVGVATIARRAGVSTGALQYHFRSKTDLLVAVVEAGWNELVERSATTSIASPVEDRVAALVGSMWESHQRPAVGAAFAISADPNIDAELAERAAATFETSRARLDQCWLEAFADLDLDGERILDARRFARSHVVGMLVQRRLLTDEPAPETELALLARATASLLTDAHPGSDGRA